MRLADYLRDHSLSYSEFARRIGTRHARTVERHAKGLQRPNDALMAAIFEATSGSVTPNDFFDLANDRQPT
jgi:hypothetical protein